MIGGVLEDHPLRRPLADELHARPFVGLPAPGRALFLALMPEQDAAGRDPARDLAHLAELLDRHGGDGPAPGANHHLADLGAFRLKWERHTEFVSYTLYESGPSETLFAAPLSRRLPEDWLADAPGKAIAAIEVEVLAARSLSEAEALLDGRLAAAFDAEGMATSRILGGNAIAVGDFRIRPDGLTRFALIAHGQATPRRIGRAVQRLIEVESYRTLAMLALPVARDATRRLNEIERELGELTARVAAVASTAPGEADPAARDAALLVRLTTLSAAIEALQADSAFRFAAGAAYEALVNQRIGMLREERLAGRQLFAEFMQRRFDPAMRTCHAAARRLGELAARASRSAELLRTRVNVAVETQNQQVLESMNRRAALQLRLQETVEGLSVVAISYYAVSLAGYLLAPVAASAGIDKTLLNALAVPPVVAAVWLSIRRVRRRFGGNAP